MIYNPKEKARITTYGGEDIRSVVFPNGVVSRTVQHWALHCGGRWVADTSIPEEKEFFEAIAEAWNRDR